MDFRKFPEFDGHELVSFFTDQTTGLRGVIAIHNTNRGPATGGTRYWHYASEEDGIRDALRLSRAMTYKCALAGLRYGGGKAVLFSDLKKTKTKRMLEAYAKKVNLLGGNFTTGEDVGITEKDIITMSKVSPFINGRPNRAGDLAPWAALGVYSAMRGALRVMSGDDSFFGRTVAIKGLGKLGFELASLIYKSQGNVVAADINPEALYRAQKKLPKIKIVGPEKIHAFPADIYSPCALGADFKKQTVKEIRAKIICGGANNQLVTSEAGEQLHQSGILYIPDYLANAGGLINVASEMSSRGYERAWVEKKVLGIGTMVARIVSLSLKTRKSTSAVADGLAEKVFRGSRI